MKQKPNILRIIIIIILLGIIGFSGFKLGSYFLNFQKAKSSIQDVQKKFNKDRQSLAELKAINPDTVAYLEIPKIEKFGYPVVQTDNNDFYLTHNFFKEYSKHGAVFMDYRNNPNFLDSNTIIYGHNMKDGTMFEPLTNFSKEDFFKAHNKVLLFTEGKTWTYEVISAYKTDSSKNNYIITNFASDKEKQAYIDKILGDSQVKTDTKVTVDNKLITLSTCTNNYDEERYVVHAILVKEEDTVSK